MRYRKYIVDLNKKMYQVANFKQFDNNIPYTLVLISNGEDVDLSGCKILAFFTNKHGKTYQKTCTITGNEVTTLIQNDILSTNGNIDVEFTIYKKETIVTTFTLKINVEKSVNKNFELQQMPEWDIISGLLDLDKTVQLKIKELDDKIVETTNITNDNTDKIDNKIIDIQDQLDNKLEESDNILNNKMTSVQNQVDGKITDIQNQLNEKIKEVDNNVSDKMTSTQNQIDNKITDVQDQLDVKFEEVDNIINDKMTSTQGQIDNKIIDVQNQLNVKIEEIDNTVSDKMTLMQNQIDNKIIDVQNQLNEKTEEVNNIVSDKVTEINEKIVEVDNSKNDFVSQVSSKITEANDKIIDVENRMQDIEGNFDSLVDGTGFASKTYVDDELGKKSDIVHNHDDIYYTINESDKRFSIKSHSHNWENIENKPTQFTPTSHTHNKSDIDDLSMNAIDINMSDNTNVEENIKEIKNSINELYSLIKSFLVEEVPFSDIFNLNTCTSISGYTHTFDDSNKNITTTWKASRLPSNNVSLQFKVTLDKGKYTLKAKKINSSESSVGTKTYNVILDSTKLVEGELTKGLEFTINEKVSNVYFNFQLYNGVGSSYTQQINTITTTFEEIILIKKPI